VCAAASRIGSIAVPLLRWGWIPFVVYLAFGKGMQAAIILLLLSFCYFSSDLSIYQQNFILCRARIVVESAVARRSTGAAVKITIVLVMLVNKLLFIFSKDFLFWHLQLDLGEYPKSHNV
jgi:branched-subunit amino acid transport protein AzlD